MPRTGLFPDYPVRTERLDLRPHREDDLEDLLTFHSLPEVVRFVPWPVRDRTMTREALQAKLSQDALRAPGEWLVLAVELREERRVVGEVLLRLLTRLGMTQEAHLRHNVLFKGAWEDQLVFGLLEDEWQPATPQP